MEGHPNITARLSAIDAAAWQVLRNAVIRALVEPQGRTTLDVNEDEGTRLIEPFQQAMLNDVAIFREQLKQMYLLGVESVQAALMGQPGVDQEMLDEVITFHSEPQDDDGEALKPW